MADSAAAWVRPPYGFCCRIPIAVSERPLICLAALGTFPPRGEGSVGAPSPIAYCLLPIAWYPPACGGLGQAALQAEG